MKKSELRQMIREELLNEGKRTNMKDTELLLNFSIWVLKKGVTLSAHNYEIAVDNFIKEQRKN